MGDGRWESGLGISYLRSSIFDLPSSIFHLRSSIFHLRPLIFYLRSAISCVRPSIFHLRSSIFARFRRGHPEWEYGPDPVRLGLEGVGVEGRAVVLDVEVVQPVEVVVHETGAEPDGIPLFQVLVDLLGAATEVLAVPIELAVVIQVVDADFEAVVKKPRAKG